MPIETIRQGGKKFRTLKQLIRPGLKAIFVGVNPALPSVQSQHYYQGRHGRRFWSRLQEFSIIGSLPQGREDEAAFAEGFGFADIVRRPTASAGKLTRSEIERGVASLIKRLRNLPDRPLLVFTYSTAAAAAEDKAHASGFETFRMPSPYDSAPVVSARMRALRRALRRSRKTIEPAPPMKAASGGALSALSQLVSSLVHNFDPTRVILFGSHARGEAGPDSDLDLLVVVDDDLPARRIDWRALHEARHDFAGAVDLIPCRESDYRERVEVVGSLPWIAATDGVVVYERDQAR